jgi:uncharacterized LabA/DUF88 family protein
MAATDSVSVVFFWIVLMERERIICFVDGLNLLHALKEINRPYLEWLNLSNLFHLLARPKSQRIQQIFYFSAYPSWKPDSYCRQKHYIQALSSQGVIPIIGKFKEKNKKCLKCNATWVDHEEKESDVNLALELLDLAYQDRYDRAFLLTRDSDFAPAVRKVKERFPRKKVTVFSLFNRFHSSELVQVCDEHKTIKLKHLVTSLFPEKIYNSDGRLIVCRPEKYFPPTEILKKLQEKPILNI